MVEFLGPLLTIALFLIVLYIALKLGKSIIILLVNSIIGLVLLFVINLLPYINITINIWSILIVAIGGVPGLILLVLLDLLKIAF